jgi:hypothetical protein
VNVKTRACDCSECVRLRTIDPNDTDRLAEQTKFDDSIREQKLIRLSYIATGNILGKNERYKRRRARGAP